VPASPNHTSGDQKKQEPKLDRGFLGWWFFADDLKGPKDLLACPTRCLSKKLNLER
jgi:hypothetical protein